MAVVVEELQGQKKGFNKVWAIDSRTMLVGVEFGPMGHKMPGSVLNIANDRIGWSHF
jgi:hypothetical protein